MRRERRKCRTNAVGLAAAISALPLFLSGGGCAASRPAGIARGGWIAVFNGRDLDNWWFPELRDAEQKEPEKYPNTWRVAGAVELDPADPTRLKAADGTGIMTNEARARAICSKQEFGDGRLHVEFMVPEKGNSGIYLLGKYELQVRDSWGYPRLDKFMCGAIYPRDINGTEADGHAPLVNACKPPGEWQSYDVVFRAPRFDAAGSKTAPARFVRVMLNNVVILENAEISGPTSFALPGPEQSAGPFMLQGNHTGVAFRNFLVRPMN